MDGSSGQGFLPCNLLHRILWSLTSKENPPTYCLISCEASLEVHYSFGFTAYKAASGGVFLRCGTPKDAVQKATTQKPLVRRSVHPRNHITCYLINCEAKGVVYLFGWMDIRAKGFYLVAFYAASFGVLHQRKPPPPPRGA